MQMAAQHDLVLHQMDVKTAYLDAPIDCEIYIDQAESFEVPSGSGGRLVYKLNKSLHGLKQSRRNWNHVLDRFLLENSYVQSPVDNCVYIKHIGSGFVAMLVWLDDLILTASNVLRMSKGKGMLKERFYMKDLGRARRWLCKDESKGASLRCLRDLRCLIVSQGLHLQNRSLSLMVKPLWILDDTLKQ